MTKKRHPKSQIQNLYLATLRYGMFLTLLMGRFQLVTLTYSNPWTFYDPLYLAGLRMLQTLRVCGTGTGVPRQACACEPCKSECAIRRTGRKCAWWCGSSGANT